MKIKKIVIVSVLAVALLGCGKREPRQFVILPDVSGSIDRESLEQAFKAIDEFAGHLQRGDKLTVVPILGDAEAEASGKILRFEVPANRQAYDSDLRKFRAKLKSSLKEMQNSAVAHPGSKTDILGTITLAQQEFSLSTNHSGRVLVILSDFIEEDRQFDFRTEQLTTPIFLQTFAKQQCRMHNTKLDNVKVYLGLLRSYEFTALATSRRNAIKSFWIQYFNDSGAHPTFFIDGLGFLNSEFLQQ